MVLFDRRGFVFCCVAMLASWGGLRLHAAPSIDDDGFLALSKKLLQREDLDPDAATKFLQGFLAIGDGEALHALAEGQSQPELEERILMAWYTGLSPDPSIPEAVTYGSALVWQAMTYTKAPGFCAVEDWSEAPAL
ncbi:sorbitol dehydrogenase family protein [Ruegeria lacuscaerulensis]|uniref:sorbitol dehydrogenase family protein n=1 Tax=Ruegeria lacuscaerulensis TaxID=55218 RepID=UPI001F22A17B|nr:sorbitol dehydrogenase family protein [Ruegeria lacuscaerulensis]